MSQVLKKERTRENWTDILLWNKRYWKPKVKSRRDLRETKATLGTRHRTNINKTKTQKN